MRAIQPAARNAARRLGPYYPQMNALSRRVRSLNGLGECPSFAPYETAGGGCSNVPAGVDAHQLFQSGGKLDDAGVYTTQELPAADAASCPGMYRNPATGVLECPTDVQQMNTAYGRFGAISMPDEATARKIADEAQRLGRARGLSITCAPYVRGGDLLNNNKPMYGADCDMGGGPGAGRHDASLLLMPGGYETAAVSASYSAGSPMYAIPQLKPSQVAPGAQDSRWLDMAAKTQAPPPASTPAQPPPVPGAPPAGPVSVAAAASRAQQILSEVASIADQAKTAATGLPAWVLIAGAAGVGLLLFKGGKR